MKTAKHEVVSHEGIENRMRLLAYSPLLCLCLRVCVHPSVCVCVRARAFVSSFTFVTTPRLVIVVFVIVSL